MGESDEPERIEIELVSDDPSSPFSRPKNVGESTVSAETIRSGGEDRRTFVIALVVGVIAVILGWMLGRSGAGPDSAPLVPEVSSPDRRDSMVSIASTLDESSATSGPVSTTIAVANPVSDDESAVESSADEIVVEQVDVAPEVAGQPIEVIVYGNGSLLQRLDLATGRLVTREVARQPFGRPRLVAGDGWVMLPTADVAFPSIVVHTEGRIRSVEFTPSWFVLGSVDGETVWLAEPELGERGTRTLDRMSELGGRVESIEVPGIPNRFDPRGGFVVEASGGAYSVNKDDVVRITPGELLAIGPDRAVAEECDERLSCAIVVIDRDTGERRSIRRDEPDAPLPRLEVIGGESVSPAGDLAIVWVVDPEDGSSGQPTIGIIDLVSGAVAEIGPAQGIDQSVWTPDGRFVLFISGGKLVAFEPATAERFIIADELIAINAFATRPITEAP